MDDRMASLFIICVILSALLFIYEGMIAPTLRIKLRYQLFTQRDRLIQLRKIHGENLGLKEFNTMLVLVNASVFALSHFNLIDVARLRMIADKGKSEQDDTVDQSDYIAQIVKETELKELKELHRSVIDTTMMALLVNSLPMFVMVLPVIVFFLVLAYMGRMLTRRMNNFREYVQRLLLLTSEIRRNRSPFGELAH